MFYADDTHIYIVNSQQVVQILSTNWMLLNHCLAGSFLHLAQMKKDEI